MPEPLISSGLRFHPTGTMIKINDMLFVVLAEWQQLCPGWLTLCAVSHSWRSPLPISQIALIPRSLLPVTQPPAHLLWSKVVASSEPAAWFLSRRGENMQSSEQMCWENSSHSPAWSWWPGSVLGSWERGKRSQGNRLPTQQLTPPLISISSYSHKPNRLTFQHGSHINRVFLVASSTPARFCLMRALGYDEDVALTNEKIFILALWKENIYLKD